MTNKQCLKCHAKIFSEKTASKKFKTMHRLHLESKLETPKKCTECHASVDLREEKWKFATKYRKKVASVSWEQPQLGV
jgi:hypothetical protein